MLLSPRPRSWGIVGLLGRLVLVKMLTIMLVPIALFIHHPPQREPAQSLYRYIYRAIVRLVGNFMTSVVPHYLRSFMKISVL